MPKTPTPQAGARPRDEPSARHSPVEISHGRARGKQTPGQSPGPRPTRSSRPPSKLGDTIFAIVHVIALIAVFIYGLAGLIQRNTGRFAIVCGGLVLYYFLVLHKALRKEVGRKRRLKNSPPSQRP